jgi:hypothetical protein
LQSHRGPGGCTRDQVYEEARCREVKGRSKMSKAQLERAVDQWPVRSEPSNPGVKAQSDVHACLMAGVSGRQGREGSNSTGRSTEPHGRNEAADRFESTSRSRKRFVSIPLSTRRMRCSPRWCTHAGRQGVADQARAVREDQSTRHPRSFVDGPRRARRHRRAPTRRAEPASLCRRRSPATSAGSVSRRRI